MSLEFRIISYVKKNAIISLSFSHYAICSCIMLAGTYVISVDFLDILQVNTVSQYVVCYRIMLSAQSK